MGKYKFLEHTADVKFQAFGKTLDETFISAGNALNETIKDNIGVLKKEKKSINVENKDLEGLLYDFLEEFLFLLDAEGFLTSEIQEVKINNDNNGESYKLKAIILGDKAKNYKFSNDVKAITYSEMEVKKGKEGWICQVVLDV